MLAFFFIALGVPVVIAVIAFVLLDGITWKELACIGLANVVVVGCSAGIVSCSSTHDVEVWNGVVTAKTQDSVSCSHSYSCNCHSCSCDAKGNCSTCCSTCYEHLNDYDWNVATTAGNVTIDRVDRQGSSQPIRWTLVRLGEPASISHSYKNYIKASPGSLFRHQGLKEKYAGSVPKYPGEVYDYFHVDRLVTVGVPVEDRDVWNLGLQKINSELGAPKQVNMIVVLVRDKPQDWYYALEESWIGGKKNDAILVVSVDNTMRPQWASVMAWTSNEMFKVKLRDDVMALDRIDSRSVLSTFSRDVKDLYVRKPMSEFEYLSSQITPSTAEWIVTLVISFLITGILIIVFQIHDPFGGGFHGFGRRRLYNRFGSF